MLTVRLDGYDNRHGFRPALTASDSINYTKALAKEASIYGMAIGLKNAQSILNDVADYVQFAVNEECVANSECSGYNTFTKTKPVFHVEYVKGTPSASQRQKMCLSGAGMQMNTAIKRLDLDGWIMECDGKSTTTKTRSANDGRS